MTQTAYPEKYVPLSPDPATFAMEATEGLPIHWKYDEKYKQLGAQMVETEIVPELSKIEGLAAVVGTGAIFTQGSEISKDPDNLTEINLIVFVEDRTTEVGASLIQHFRTFQSQKHPDTQINFRFFNDDSEAAPYPLPSSENSPLPITVDVIALNPILAQIEVANKTSLENLAQRFAGETSENAKALAQVVAYEQVDQLLKSFRVDLLAQRTKHKVLWPEKVGDEEITVATHGKIRGDAEQNASLPERRPIDLIREKLYEHLSERDRLEDEGAFEIAKQVKEKN